MFIHLPLIYFAPPPCLLIDFKNSKWLPYFCILLCICYCFSHLIGLLSVTWLSLLYKFTRFFCLFSVSLWRRANARNVRLYHPYWQYTDLFIFRFVSLLCLRSTLRLLNILIARLRNNFSKPSKQNKNYSCKSKIICSPKSIFNTVFVNNATMNIFTSSERRKLAEGAWELFLDVKCCARIIFRRNRRVLAWRSPWSK